MPKSQKTSRKALPLRVEPVLYEKVKSYAELTGQTMNAVTEEALMSYMGAPSTLTRANDAALTRKVETDRLIRQLAGEDTSGDES